MLKTWCILEIIRNFTISRISTNFKNSPGAQHGLKQITISKLNPRPFSRPPNIKKLSKFNKNRFNLIFLMILNVLLLSEEALLLYKEHSQNFQNAPKEHFRAH